MPIATYTARFPHPPLDPHLHHQRVQVDDRIHPVQRTRLPRLDLLHHRFGHVRDQRRRHLHLIHLLQVALNLARRHAPRIERQNLFVEAMPTRLALRHQLRLEARSAIPRHLDLDRAEVAPQTLLACPVAAVAAPTAFHAVLLVPQMRCQLRPQRTLDDRLGQLPQQPVLASDILHRRTPLQQLIDQSRIQSHTISSPSLEKIVYTIRFTPSPRRRQHIFQ